MIRSLSSVLFFAAGVAVAAPALAQPADPAGAPVVASQPVPDTSRASPGIPSDQAVNPAPGAHGPYVGAGRQGFYDVDARIASISQAAAQLPPAQRRRAMSQIHSIKSLEATQRARHGGELRDWDREAMNHRLDQLVQTFPSLQAEGGAPPPPAQ